MSALNKAVEGQKVVCIKSKGWKGKPLFLVAISACQNERAVLTTLESLILHYGTGKPITTKGVKNIYCQFFAWAGI